MPGAPDCAALRDLLLARDFEQSALFWQHHRVAIDAYCVQHASYVKSAKSLAAHLCGLCVAFERGNSPDALRQLQAWLSTNPDIRKPALPTERGKLTIAHVSGIIDPRQYGDAVREWAQSAWDAYRELHPVARQWLSMSETATQRNTKLKRH